MRAVIFPTSQIVCCLTFSFLLFVAPIAFAAGEPTNQASAHPTPAADSAIASEVSSIKINSYGGGAITELAITRSSGSGFMRNGKCIDPGMPQPKEAPSRQFVMCAEKDVPVSDTVVAALMRALRARRIETPLLAATGIDQSRLDDLARRECAGENKTSNCASGSPRQKDLYFRSLTDFAQAQQSFAELFRSWGGGDYPKVEVVVDFINGKKIELASDSYQPLMLPWKIDSRKNYNGRISHALAALMPAGARNRLRLSVEALEEELARQTRFSIEGTWNEIGAEEEAGPVLDRLRVQYKTANAEVNEYHQFDSGVKWSSMMQTEHERNLHVTLRRSDWPANFSLHLTLHKGAAGVEGVDDFLSRAPTYAQKLLGVAWLRDFFKRHPKQHLVLRYVRDASLGEKALGVFAADMQAAGRSALAAEVAANRREVIFFAAVNDGSKSNWLLMPDGRIILWRQDNYQPILHWKPENFTAYECADYYLISGGCSGAIVSPVGKLVDDMLRSPLESCMTPEARAQLTAAQAERKGKHDPLFPIHSSRSERDDIAGYIDASGRVILPMVFESAGEFHEGRASFSCGGRWGFLDDELNVVVPPTLSLAKDFSEGLARVQTKGDAFSYGALWGFMDRQGRMAIAPKLKALLFDSVEANFHDGLAMVEGKDDSCVGYINKKGKLVIPTLYSLSWGFHEGLAATESPSNGKFGYLDRQGRWAIQPQYSRANSFNEGFAVVETSGECLYINAANEPIMHLPKLAGEHSCSTKEFREGLAPVEKDGKYGYIDKSGAFVIVPQFDNAHSFREGLAAAKKDGKFGYIDKSGAFVIEPQFDSAYIFSEGFAAVSLGSRTTYIDRTGRQIAEPRELFRVDEFRNGLAYYVTREGLAAGYIDKTGRIVWEEKKQ
jgi:hypothetical protein